MPMRELICRASTLALISASLIACASDEASREDDTPPTETNPLAMPCGPLNSGFDGDERCILPPAPEDGIQLHVGPTDYNDPDQIAEFILQPGQEVTECYYFNNPSTVPINFFKQVYRMRPGSHHLIIHTQLGGTSTTPGWRSCYGAEDSGYMPIGGTQNGVSEFPPNGEVAPEDIPLIRPLTPGAPMKFEMHFINTTTEPILREAWVNLENKKFPDEDGDGRPDVTAQILGGIFMIGGRAMDVQVGEKEVMNYWCDNNLEGRRIVSLFGHRHAHTTRFSVWLNRNTDREQLIYEDYDYRETQEYVYNSLIQNPTPNPPAGTPGGASGLLVINSGDRIEFECEIDNTDAQNTLLKASNPSFEPVPLNFANEVYTGEMCNLFGSMVLAEPDPNASGLSGFFWGNRDTTLCSPRD